MIVLWAPVPGYEGIYQVSNTGSVFSVPRKGSRGGMLRQGRSEDYPMVSLTRGGEAKPFKVHRLVLEAFEGPCPPGRECRHLDGNRMNNAWPENLEWGTRRENNLDRTRHGTNPSCRISDNQVVNAFEAWEAGAIVSVLANTLGVSDTALRNRMKDQNSVRYDRLATGNRKLSDKAALVFYQRWRAGESKSSLAREAGVSRRLLTFRFAARNDDPFAGVEGVK